MDVVGLRGELTLDNRGFKQTLRASEAAAEASVGRFASIGQRIASAFKIQPTINVADIARGIQAAADAIIGQAADIQQAVANISTIKPEIDTSQVTNALQEISTRVPQTAKQLADSLYDVFSSIDVSQAEALKLTEKFAKGAVGAQTDAKSFGTAVIGVMNAYGLSVKDADHISDVFFNTVKSGVVTGQELAGSLGPVTQSAKTAGVSLDELGAAITAVTKEGGPAAQNINNLSNLFSKFTTKEAQAGIQALGVATVDAQGKFRPFLDVIGDMRDRLAGVTEAAKAKIFQAIVPDVQAKQGLATLISQLDVAKKQLKENSTAAGSAESAYRKMSATFAAQSQLLKNSFNAVLTTIGSALLPAITPLVKAFSDHLPAAIKTVREFLSGLSPAGQQAAQAFRSVSDVAVGIFAPAARIVQQAWGILSAWFKQNLPLIQRTFQTVVRTIQEIWQKHGATIMGIIRPIWNVVSTIIGTALRNLLAIIRTVMQVITGDWSGAWETMKGMVKTSWDGIVGIVENIGPALLNAGKLVISSIFDLGTRLGAAIWDGITGGARRQQEAAKKLIASQVKDSVPAIGHGMGDLKLIEDRGRLAAAATLAVRKKEVAASVAHMKSVAESEALAKKVAAASGRGGKDSKKTPAQEEAEQLAKQLTGNAAIRHALAAGESVDMARLSAQYTHLSAAQIRQAVADEQRTNALIAQKEATKSAWQEVEKLQAKIRDVRGGGGKEQTILEQYAKASPAARAALTTYTQSLAAAIEKAKLATDGQRALNAAGRDAHLAFLKATAGTDLERLALDKLNIPLERVPANMRDALQAIIDWETRTKQAANTTAQLATAAEKFFAPYQAAAEAVKAAQGELARNTIEAEGNTVQARLNAVAWDIAGKKFIELPPILLLVANAIAKVRLQAEQAAAAPEAYASAVASWADDVVSEWEYIWEQEDGKAADALRSFIDRIEKRDAPLRKAAEQQAAFMGTMAQGTERVFQGMFDNLFDRGFKNFASDLVGGFSRMWQQIASDYLSSKITDLIFGGANPQGQRSGGFIDKLGGLIGGLIGGGGGGGGGAAAGWHAPMALAGGGAVTAGKQYLVGERGPEMFRSNQGGTMTPNNQLGITNNHTINVMVRGEDTPAARKNARAMGVEISRELQRQSRRNG